MSLTEAQRLKKIAMRGRDDLYYFCKEILGNDKMRDKPHKELSDFIKESKKRKKLILMPRGSFKSTEVTVGYSLQKLVRNPDARCLIASETQSKAIKFVSEIKGHIQENPKFRALYGDWVNKGNIWKANEFVIKPRRAIKKEPSVVAGSLEKGSAGVGMHYDFIILDDPVSMSNINSQDQIQKTIDYYKLLLSILEPDGELIVIGTRWGSYELYGWLMDPAEPESQNIDVFHRAAEDDSGKLLMPEVLNRDFLDEMRVTQGEYIYQCNPGYTPVLMSNFTTKRMDEVKVGDEVVGFEVSTTPGRSTKLVKSVVEEVNSRLAANMIEAKTNGGNLIRCTADHKWYKQNKKNYSPIGPSSPLLRVFDCEYTPNREQELAWQYLAGIVDGEGACRHGSIAIGQSYTHNKAVCDRIDEVLAILEIPYNKREDKPGELSWVLSGGRETKIKLLQWGKPAKKDQILKTIWDRPGNLRSQKQGIPKKRDHISEVMPQEGAVEKVYALKTTSGNYIAWGFASKNCQYQNKITNRDLATFRQEDIKLYDKTPPGLIWFMTVDPAVSLKEGADFTGIMINGVDYNHDWWIERAIRLRLSQKDLIDKIFELQKQFNPIMVLGMQKFALEKLLKENLLLRSQETGEFLPIKDIPTNTKVSKDARIKALQPRSEQGKIHIKNTEENQDLVYEMISHPGCKNDDLLDCLQLQLAITFPSDNKPERDQYPDLSHLSPRMQKEWQNVRKVTKRKIKRKHEVYL